MVKNINGVLIRKKLGEEYQFVIYNKKAIIEFVKGKIYKVEFDGDTPIRIKGYKRNQYRLIHKLIN